MQPKNCTAVSQFVLKDRSNQELLDGAKHLVGRQRTVTAHLIAHLAEIDARGLHLVESFPTLTKYCMGALGLSEDEAYRRAYAAELARKYPVILDLLLCGSIHLTALRTIGPCLTAKNHNQVLEASRGKSKTELEHLVAMVRPKPDVPTVLRKLPDPGPDPAQPDQSLFTDQSLNAETHPEEVGVTAGQEMEMAPVRGASSSQKPVLAPLSPRRYKLQLTIDDEFYDALTELKDLLRHQVPNGDLMRIIKDSVLERRDRVKRERLGQTKRPRKTREQGSWIDAEKPAAEVSATEKEPIAPGRFQVNSRHIPAAVKREVWERDQGRCAFVSHRGRRCAERQWLEFHHLHAYALGGPATVENIALFCRAHNAHEGVRVFGERAKSFTRPRASSGSSQLGANGAATRPGASGESTRPGASGESTRPRASSS
jgi:hypothetical protein